MKPLHKSHLWAELLKSMCLCCKFPSSFFFWQSRRVRDAIFCSHPVFSLWSGCSQLILWETSPQTVCVTESRGGAGSRHEGTVHPHPVAQTGHGSASALSCRAASPPPSPGQHAVPQELLTANPALCEGSNKMVLSDLY